MIKSSLARAFSSSQKGRPERNPEGGLGEGGWRLVPECAWGQQLRRLGTLGCSGEPCVVVDPRGNAYDVELFGALVVV